jgi:hypothetical protein
MTERSLPSLASAMVRPGIPSRDLQSFYQSLTGDERSYHGCARSLIDDVESIRRTLDEVFWFEFSGKSTRVEARTDV